jgi:hypothetical protein
MEHARHLGQHEKTKPTDHGYKRGEKIQTKGIFSRIRLTNFPNFEKERVIQIQEAYKTPNNQDQKRNTPMHIIIKTFKTQNKKRIWKAAKEKRQVTYKGKPIRITLDLSF